MTVIQILDAQIATQTRQLTIGKEVKYQLPEKVSDFLQLRDQLNTLAEPASSFFKPVVERLNALRQKLESSINEVVEFLDDQTQSTEAQSNPSVVALTDQDKQWIYDVLTLLPDLKYSPKSLLLTHANPTARHSANKAIKTFRSDPHANNPISLLAPNSLTQQVAGRIAALDPTTQHDGKPSKFTFGQNEISFLGYVHPVDDSSKKASHGVIQVKENDQTHSVTLNGRDYSLLFAMAKAAQDNESVDLNKVWDLYTHPNMVNNAQGIAGDYTQLLHDSNRPIKINNKNISIIDFLKKYAFVELERKKNIVEIKKTTNSGKSQNSSRINTIREGNYSIERNGKTLQVEIRRNERDSFVYTFIRDANTTTTPSKVTIPIKILVALIEHEGNVPIDILEKKYGIKRTENFFAVLESWDTYIGNVNSMLENLNITLHQIEEGSSQIICFKADEENPKAINFAFKKSSKTSTSKSSAGTAKTLEEVILEKLNPKGIGQSISWLDIYNVIYPLNSSPTMSTRPSKPADAFPLLLGKTIFGIPIANFRTSQTIDYNGHKLELSRSGIKLISSSSF